MFSSTLNLLIMRLCDLSIAHFDRKSLHLCFTRQFLHNMEQSFGVSAYRRLLCLLRFFQYVLISILSASLFDLLVLFPVLSCFFLLTIPTYSPLVHFGFKKFSLHLLLSTFP